MVRPQGDRSVPQIGLVLTGAYEPESDPHTVVRRQVELAQAAEAAGFNSVWMGEHYLGGASPWLQNIPLMAHLAAETERVALGLFVIAPLHGILELAEQLATLDILSDGRAAACFVRGWRAEEFAAFGVPLSTASERLAEAVVLVLRLWRGEEVTASGHNRFDRVRIGARPIQLPEMPLFMGGSSLHAVEQAAALGRPFIHSSHVAIGQAETLTRRYLAAGGCGPSAIVRQFYVAGSDQVAIGDATPLLGAYYRVYDEWGLPSARPVVTTFDSAARAQFILGDPGTCADKLKEYAVRLGVTTILCRIGWPGLEHQKVLDAIRLVGSEVMPRVSDA